MHVRYGRSAGTNFLVAPNFRLILAVVTSFPSFLLRQALRAHKRRIEELELWDIYEKTTGSCVPKHEGSLLGKFFEPTVDIPTLDILCELKQKGYRVICGTNVNDSHYTIHHRLHQYDIFDHVYASHLLHSAKPEGAFFQSILESEQLEPDQLFFTDDMPANIESARTQGLEAYLYTDAIALQAQLEKLKILR